MKAPQRPGAPRSSQARSRPTPRTGVPVVSPPSASSSMSWRAVVLTAVMALALAVMVPSVRAYLKQRETLQDLQGQVVDAQAQVDELQGQAARWSDPAYVVAQARDRLVYVLPGETPYRVVDPEFVTGADGSGTAASNADTAADAPAAPTEPERPWFATMWRSIESAGGDA